MLRVYHCQAPPQLVQVSSAKKQWQCSAETQMSRTTMQLFHWLFVDFEAEAAAATEQSPDNKAEEPTIATKAEQEEEEEESYNTVRQTLVTLVKEIENILYATIREPEEREVKQEQEQAEENKEKETKEVKKEEDDDDNDDDDDHKDQQESKTPAGQGMCFFGVQKLLCPSVLTFQL